MVPFVKSIAIAKMDLNAILKHAVQKNDTVTEPANVEVVGLRDLFVNHAQDLMVYTPERCVGGTVHVLRYMLEVMIHTVI